MAPHRPLFATLALALALSPFAGCAGAVPPPARNPNELPSCGAPVSAQTHKQSPRAVLAAPEPGSAFGMIAGTSHLAQQTGSSVFIWDLTTGALTATLRDARLLAGDPARERFVIERDRRIVSVEPSGGNPEVVSEVALEWVRMLHGNRAARAIGSFRESSEAHRAVWLDAHGHTDNLRFGVCSDKPYLAELYDREVAVSADEATLAQTSTTFDLRCGEQPLRIMLWSLDDPAAKARVIPTPWRFGKVEAIRNDRTMAVLSLSDVDPGKLQLVRLPATDGKPEVVGQLPALMPGHAHFVGADLVVVLGKGRSYAWSVSRKQNVWERESLSGRLSGDQKTVLIDSGAELTALSVDDGRVKWTRRKGTGSPALSRDDRSVVVPETEGAGLAIVDLSSGKLVRKLGVVPLHAVDEVVFAGDQLVTRHARGMTFWSMTNAAVVKRSEVKATGIEVDASGHLFVASESACEGGTGTRIDAWSGMEPPPNPGRIICKYGTLEAQLNRLVVPVTDDQTRKASFETHPLGEGAPRSLEAVNAGQFDGQVSSADGRRMAAFVRGESGTRDDNTRVVAWDTQSGEVMADFGCPLTEKGRKELFGSHLDAASWVSPEVEAIALSPDGRSLAVGYDHVLWHKPNWSYETIEGHAPRVALMGVEDGKPAVASLDAPASALLWLTADTLVAAGERRLALVKGGQVVARAAFDGGVVKGVTARPDGSVIATWHVDGTVRVWDASTLAMRAMLLDFSDGEYLATTPGGAYAGTAEVAERMGWVFDEPLEPFRFEQFAKVFGKREVVAKRLATGEGDIELLVPRPPRVELSAAPPASTREALIKIKARVSSATRVDSVRTFVEGRPVLGAAPCHPDAAVELEVPLSAGSNRVALVAFDDQGLVSNTVAFDVVRLGVDVKPEVHVISVGVDRYPGLGEGSQLRYAKADAVSIGKLFESQSGPGKTFSRADVKVLTDDAATPSAIEAALDSLSSMKP